MSDFRCSVASLARAEPVTGTASTVRAFLLVEEPGPWGVDALADSRLPDAVTAALQLRSRAARVRPLLVRRHRARPEPGAFRVFAAFADPVSPWLETARLTAPEELLDLDVEALGRGESPGLTRTDTPVVAVCTQGRHDACCAERGRPVAAALSASHPEVAWEVSHVGGDRFAANVLVLPEGLYYGRVTPETAPDLAATHLAGALTLELLRGRSSMPMPAQVAEVALRRRYDATGLSDVRLLSSRTSGTDTVVRFALAGKDHEVVVRRTLGEDTHQLTCRARRENPVPRYEVLRLS